MIDVFVCVESESMRRVNAKPNGKSTNHPYKSQNPSQKTNCLPCPFTSPRIMPCPLTSANSRPLILLVFLNGSNASNSSSVGCLSSYGRDWADEWVKRRMECVLWRAREAAIERGVVEKKEEEGEENGEGVEGVVRGVRMPSVVVVF